jgi:hypothetical protein
MSHKTLQFLRIKRGKLARRLGDLFARGCIKAARKTLHELPGFNEAWLSVVLDHPHMMSKLAEAALVEAMVALLQQFARIRHLDDCEPRVGKNSVHSRADIV